MLKSERNIILFSVISIFYQIFGIFLESYLASGEEKKRPKENFEKKNKIDRK